MIKIDQKKLERQLAILELWISLGAIGTCELVTGFGKSYLAILAMKRLLQKDPSRRTLVIVPTIPLKAQWEEDLILFGVPNVTVTVINTIILSKKPISTELLVLDEIHKFASEEFVKLFDVVDYSWILGLTATLTRTDGKHTLLEAKAPVICTITQQEGVEENYISAFREYNLGIELNPADRKHLEELNKQFHFYFGKFGHDFKQAMACVKKEAAELYAATHNLDPKKVGYEANRFNYYMRQRKDFLYKASCKLDTAVAIMNKLKLKTVTFSESTEFANKLSNLTPGSGCYHSYIDSIVENNGKKIATAKKVDKKTFFVTDDGSVLDFKQLKILYPKCKKVGRKAQKERVIALFKQDLLDSIHTAKALDQGFNVEDVELGIIASATSNPTQQIQRGGRIIRKFTFKNGRIKAPIIVNLYIKDSQDEKWLKTRQKDPKTGKPINPGVKWIKSIDDIGS